MAGAMYVSEISQQTNAFVSHHYCIFLPQPIHSAALFALRFNHSLIRFDIPHNQKIASRLSVMHLLSNYYCIFLPQPIHSAALFVL